MKNAASAQYRVISKECHEMVLFIIRRNTIAISFYVSEITNMSCLCIWATMSLIEWIIVRTRSSASLKKVTKLMNMETMKTWLKSLKFSRNSAFRVKVWLFESYDARCGLIWLRVKNANCSSCVVSWVCTFFHSSFLCRMDLQVCCQEW